MSYKPIIFCDGMVRAILDGRKTQTRRVIRNVGEHTHRMDSDDGIIWGAYRGVNSNGAHVTYRDEIKAPFAKGSVLWVRETWQETIVDYAGGGYDLHDEFVYRADFKPQRGIRTPDKWQSPMFMPRKAARIFLEVESVYAQRVQEITSADAVREGMIEWETPDDIVRDFKVEWNTINGKRAGGRYDWRYNPWVWVVSFRRCGKPEAWI